jgi:hypothetical protein
MENEMRRLINMFENMAKEINKKNLSEAGFSSVANTMRGLRKNIKTLSILTAENPFGKPADKLYNKKANRDLEKTLSEGGYGYRKVKGSYEGEENSFIVNNISQYEAINIGKKYNQDSIIYGEVVKKDDEKIYMVFRMIGTDPNKNFGEIMGETKVFVNRENAKDFYSEVNGRKFVLPFYNVIDDLQGPDGKTYEITRDYSGTEWEDGGLAMPTKIDIKDKPEKIEEDKDLEDELNKLQETVFRTAGSTAYNYRSKINYLIRKNNLIL